MLQRGSGNDSGMTCHIERKDAQGKTYVPDNADRSRTHLNRELVSFPDGVRNRTEAIQYRIDHAGLTRKVAGNQCKAVRIILTGTHEQMMRIQEEGRLERWIEANLKWLHETFGKENVVSCVLHMDEKTPHLYATIVPIVHTERQRREREGERKYNTNSGPRLSADDVLKRAKLHEYQNTYAAAMSEFGLKRGIVGSTARHIATSTHYKQQMQQLEENIANLQEEVEKTKEGKSTLLAIFGKGNLAKARTGKIQAQITRLEAEKATLKQKYESDIAKLRNGYQKEIDAAIRRAEIVERKVAEKEAVIERQKSRFEELDRKANPQRYRLSSEAELIGHRFLGNNPYTVTLKIWTKVKEIEHTAVTYLSDGDKRLHAFSNGEPTEHEFVNACFCAAEQVNEMQSDLLSAAIELTTGGSAQPYVGSGGGGSTSQLPWRDKDNDKNNNIKQLMERNEDRTMKGLSIKLCFRPSSVPKKVGRLYYQIIFRRASYQYNSQHQIYETEWSKQTGLIITEALSQRGKELMTIRKRTEWETAKLYEVAQRMFNVSDSVDYDLVVHEFETQKAQQSLRSYVMRQIVRLEQKGKSRTSETYLSTYRSFMRFLKRDDILLYEIDQNMIEDYELWLQKDGLTPNSTSFYMRILHTILNKAVRQSLIPSCDFFQNVYTGIATTTKRAIGIDPLKRIKTLDLRLFPQLDFARDMFFLSLYFRGMSFIDMANLQHKNLQNGHLVYCRQKTGQRLDIKWERQMTDILDKYSTDAKYLLPILKTPDGESRKYYKNMGKQVNRWLKKIGTMAGIQIPLTMYVARHTWASLAKQKNIPLNVISDGLGHDSEKTTLIYLSTLDTSAVDDANSKILADLL